MDLGTVPELETERLLMRGWKPSDFEVFAAYQGDPETARFVGGQMTRDRAWRHFAATVGHWTLKGFGYWAVEEKASGELIGCVGVWEPEGWPEIELGYWLVSHKQGEGYALEAALKARDYAYSTMGLKTVVSYIDPSNEPSKRLAERMGARCEEIIDLVGNEPHCVYRHPPAP